MNQGKPPESKPEFNDVEGREAQEANAILLELGDELRKDRAGGEYWQYLGSAAVHIYRTENLEQIFYISQVDGTIRGTPEAIASDAFTHLQNKMMSHYGRRERRSNK